jgi:hypothetical protein
MYLAYFWDVAGALYNNGPFTEANLDAHGEELGWAEITRTASGLEPQIVRPTMGTLWSHRFPSLRLTQ